MNKRKIITIAAVTLVVAVAVGLLIARLQKRPAAQLEDAKTVYMNAADAAAGMHNFVLKLTQSHQITTTHSTYTENSNALLSCEGLGSDEMKVSRKETLTIGKHHTEYSEIFSDDTLYTVINDSYFTSMIAAADYMQSITPIVLMDHHLYDTFSGVDSGEEYVIHISGTDTPETWAHSGDIIFTEASGTAYVNYAGKLTKSIYILEYKLEDVSHRVTIVSQLTEQAPMVTVPKNTESYIPIQHSQGPLMLEKASGYLTQMHNIRAVSEETTYFEAFGDTRTKTVTLETKNDIDWSATVETETKLSNTGRPDQDSIYQQTETFKIGVYEVKTPDIPTAQNLDISEEQMQNYCLNILVGTIMLPKDILQCQTEISNGVVRFTYTANSEFARQISQNACNALYQDPNLLTDLAQESIMDEVTGYLEVDANTGLPLASGIYYASTYTTEELPYHFRFHADQTYQIITEKK